MNKNDKNHASKPVILSDYEKIEAEEYIEDTDHVYRKKEEVTNKSFKGSIFWKRFACFLGLTSLSFVFIYKVIKLIVNVIQAGLHGFKDLSANGQMRKSLDGCFTLSQILAALAVGVINPNWGKRLMSLFFSMSPKKPNSFFSSFIFST